MESIADLRSMIEQTLTMIITPDQQLIEKGQTQLQALELLDSYTLALTEISIDNTRDISIRQLAGVLLRKYVSKHWTRDIESFIEPEVPEQMKSQIRRILPHGLNEPNHRLRVGLACVISAVAEWDCPESWPELLPFLIDSLKSTNKSLIHGSIRVLTEIVRDLDDRQLPVVLPLLLPEMYRLMVSNDFSLRIRTRAIGIFTLLVSLVHDINEHDRILSVGYILPYLSHYCEAFKRFLVAPDSSLMTDTGCRIETIRALTLLFKSFPKLMQQNAAELLQSVWTCLTSNTENYVATVVYKHGEMDASVDSDGETLSFECLIYSLFEFVQVLMDLPTYKNSVKTSMEELCYYLILCMQITEEEYDSWSKNVSRYVEDESDDSFSHSVRLSALELLLSITNEFKKEAGIGLWKAVHRHLSHAEALKTHNSSRWWKLHEACLLAMGRCKQLLNDMLVTGYVKIDLDAFVRQVPLADLSQFDYPYLVCQAALFAGRFSRSLSPEVNRIFLDGICQLLENAQHPIINLSSLRAFYYYCEEVGVEQTNDVVAYLPRIFEGILATMSRIPQSAYIWPLESLAILISVDENFVATIEHRLSPLAIELFVNYIQDPLINGETTAILKGLVHNNKVSSSIQERLIPLVQSILENNSASSTLPRIAPSLAFSVLDLLTTVLRSLNPPINSNLLHQTFPVVVHLLLTSDDQQILINGGECLCAFLSCVSVDLFQWTDPKTNISSIEYILQILAKFLDPKTPENCCTFIGKLIRGFIREINKTNQPSLLGDTLGQILKAVLAKLQSSQVLSVQQSLIVVFAHLIQNNLNDVVNFLNSTPGPQGSSAFDFVMYQWVTKQHLFAGPYDIKVSIIALTGLLEYAMTNNDVRFQTLIVPGDQIVYQQAGQSISHRTRSRTSKQPEQWTRVPLVVKLFKILVLELQNQINTRKELEEDMNFDDDDDDDEDADNDGNDDITVEKEGDNESNLLKATDDETTKYLERYDNLLDDVFDYEFFQEKDPDAFHDPLMQVDLLDYLKERLRLFATHAWFAIFQQHLNVIERSALQKITVLP
ncbi:hypothetical protein I4U23_003087 [Adineta vaga]|nr:hypothetical protein I4U23_003087 [Adineta vaga]